MTLPEANHISVTKTARYFTLGKLDETTKEIWFVLHGYAQLASDFIQEFSPLDNGTRFIVAPEALNRFYAKGFGGNPAASWMTSEDREHEIYDYVNYLITLYHSLSIAENIKVVLLGFSQGVATASRFIHNSNCRVDSFIICSGEIGAEVANPISERLSALQVTYITGNKDPFITREKHDRVFELLDKLGAKILIFDGGHEINIHSLMKLN